MHGVDLVGAVQSDARLDSGLHHASQSCRSKQPGRHHDRVFGQSGQSAWQQHADHQQSGRRFGRFLQCRRNRYGRCRGQDAQRGPRFVHGKSGRIRPDCASQCIDQCCPESDLELGGCHAGIRLPDSNCNGCRLQQYRLHRYLGDEFTRGGNRTEQFHPVLLACDCSERVRQHCGERDLLVLDAAAAGRLLTGFDSAKCLFNGF